MTFHSRNTDSLPWGLWVFPAFALVWAGSWLVSRGLVDFGTCGLKQLLGIPCLSCGATRATLLLLGGAPFAALTMQPLVILGYGLLATWGIASLGTVVTGRTLEVSLTRRESMCLKVAVVVLPLANWCYLVAAGI